MYKKNIFLILAFLPIYQNSSCAFTLGSLWQKTESETINKDYLVSEKCTITVHNTEGSITVKSWPQNKILIEATKKGSSEEQKNTTISAKASGSQASIITRVAPEQKSSKVDYTLMVPEDSMITITQTNGPIKLRGLAGAITASLVEKGPIDITECSASVNATTNNGDISVQQKKFDEQGSIFLKSERGNISLLIPRETKAYLNAKTEAGTIVSAQPVTIARKTTQLNAHYWEQTKKEVEGTLGGLEADAPITLATTKGTISLKEY
jgi:DUF4097 and DUF4098 domain-containing protein YvlB